MTITLGVDLDGVVFDLMTPLLAQYNKDYDDDMTKEDITNFRFEKDRFKCGRLAYNYLYDPRIQFASPVFDDAEDALMMFMTNKKIDVIFATSTSRAVMHAKLARLEQMFPSSKFPYGFFLGRDKTMVNCDVFIEDAIHNALDMINEGRQVIMPDQPWNRSLTHAVRSKTFLAGGGGMWPIIRVENWQEIMCAVLELV